MKRREGTLTAETEVTSCCDQSQGSDLNTRDNAHRRSDPPLSRNQRNLLPVNARKTNSLPLPRNARLISGEVFIFFFLCFETFLGD